MNRICAVLAILIVPLGAGSSRADAPQGKPGVIILEPITDGSASAGCAGCGSACDSGQRCGHRLWGWLSYRPQSTCGNCCGHTSVPCCTPELYSYFLCRNGQGCGACGSAHANGNAGMVIWEDGSACAKPKHRILHSIWETVSDGLKPVPPASNGNCAPQAAAAPAQPATQPAPGTPPAKK